MLTLLLWKRRQRRSVSSCRLRVHGKGAVSYTHLGSAVGSVGGGIMEYRTQQLARELLEPGAAPCRLAAFTTEGASDAAAIAACGGSMEVFLQRLEPEE